VALSEIGEGERAVEINRRGVEISKRGAGPGVRVFAAIGPTGKRLGTREIDRQSVLEAFRTQADALAEAGADALLFETFSDLDEARLAVIAARPLELPILVSFSFDGEEIKDGSTPRVRPETVARAMAEEGVDAVGANCGAGPDGFPALCRRLKEASGLPVWIKPNAGLPVISEGRAVYPSEPESFAGFVPALIEAGASFVGGCCGTSPDFIRAVVRVAERYGQSLSS
jgi:methionine synthase I (cobalamin-dependent)